MRQLQMLLEAEQSIARFPVHKVVVRHREGLGIRETLALRPAPLRLLSSRARAVVASSTLHSGAWVVAAQITPELTCLPKASCIRRMFEVGKVLFLREAVVPDQTVGPQEITTRLAHLTRPRHQHTGQLQLRGPDQKEHSRDQLRGTLPPRSDRSKLSNRRMIPRKLTGAPNLALPTLRSHPKAWRSRYWTAGQTHSEREAAKHFVVGAREEGAAAAAAAVARLVAVPQMRGEEAQQLRSALSGA
mmetsp:Transcript_5774/g.15403  ORF Transcript_5774/g.15403 Transcript_5774/m.15403 type:complete len:245 (+) Transcript_5774:719-1453(+)